MKKINVGGGAVVAVAGLLAVGGAAYFLKKKGGAVAGAVVDAVNPMSDKNIAYRGVNALGELSSGSDDWTLGGAIYDATHKEYNPNSLDGYNPSFSFSSALDSVYGGGLGYILPGGLAYKGATAVKDVFSSKGATAASSEPWYDGYQMESWEIDNPFGEAPTLSSPVKYAADKLGGDNKSEEFTWRDILPWNAFSNMVSGLSK